MRLKKLIASLGVLLCLGTNIGAAAYAETTMPFVDGGVSLMYEIAINPKSYLSIEGDTANCISSVDGADTASITVTQTLQKYWGLWIWTDVKDAEWSDQVNDSSIRLSNSKSGLDSGKYRLKSVFTLTDNNGKSETITIKSDEKTVS